MDPTRLLRRLVTPFDAPPDGGWGWVVTAAAFVVHVVVLGLAYSYGVLFRALLADDTMDGSNDRAAVSLVGSISVSVMLGMGVITGSLVHSYGHRRVTLAGGLIMPAALAICSYAPSIWLLYPSYGVLLGAGYSMSFGPALMMVNRYFTTKRSLAVGLAVAGSGAGTFLFSTVNERLVENVGWRNALRLDALFALVTVTLGAATFVPVNTAASPSVMPVAVPAKDSNVTPATAPPPASAEAHSGGSVDSSSAPGHVSLPLTVDTASAAPQSADSRSAPNLVEDPWHEPGSSSSSSNRLAATLSQVQIDTASVLTAEGHRKDAADSVAPSSPPLSSPPLKPPPVLSRWQVYRTRPFLQVAAAITCYAGAYRPSEPCFRNKRISPFNQLNSTRYT